MENPGGGIRGEIGLLGAAAVVLGIAGFGAFMSYKQRQAARLAQAANVGEERVQEREREREGEGEQEQDAFANHPLLEHVKRIVSLLGDRESGDRACSRALDVVVQLSNTEDGRLLLSRQGILTTLVDLLYRSVATPSSADPSPSSSLQPSTPGMSPDLHDVLTKAISSISNLSLDLAHQQLLRRIHTFPLLVRFLADDMDDEIKQRALQALLNLSVFENLNEDTLRGEGLLRTLPDLLAKSRDDSIRALCLKVLRNLVVSNEVNARILLESDILSTCLALLGESDILSQRSLELVHSLLPTSLKLPPIPFESLAKLFPLLDPDTSLSDSLNTLASKIIVLLTPHLDHRALHALEQFHSSCHHHSSNF